MEGESLTANNGGGKRKLEDDTIELAKQKAQAIAARFVNDVDSKRLRTGFDSSSPTMATMTQSPSFSVPYTTQTNHYTGVPSSKKIIIPNAKVGVIIGRGGDMIRNIQQQSGAKIQITRDTDADPTCLTRDVELMGSQDQISRAEALINEVIAETDAANSASTGNKNAGTLQPGSEQTVMKVPSDKVALIIGKGGETIKTMQSSTGARIQVVPLRPPPGDTSTERNVYISGTKEQIESAKELVNEVISGNRLKVLPNTNTYAQSAYPQASGWPPQGQQQPPYSYTQPVSSYPMQPPPYYGGYPPQQTGWEQHTTTAVAPSQPLNTGYNYNQGYPQQPQYGQDMSGQGQAPPSDPAKPYANPLYGPPATNSQPDGSATVEPSQPGYGPPTPSGQPDTPTSAAAPASGYGAYPGYSAPPAQTDYTQTGYAQQLDGQVSTQASHSYYGQSAYPPVQSGYYQGAYPSIPAPQVAPQTQPQPGNESENLQS